jgi:uncharacterized protein (UPF0248 family)
MLAFPMQTAIQLISKIRWDPRERPEEYVLFYQDRLATELKALPFPAIKRVEGTFLIVERDGEETSIPAHRIRQVRRNGALVWERQPGARH